MKNFMKNKWVKLLLSAIPSIYQDFTYGHSGSWTHYGMLIVGLLYLIESLLWVIDIWKDGSN